MRANRKIENVHGRGVEARKRMGRRRDEGTKGRRRASLRSKIEGRGTCVLAKKSLHMWLD
jgi:hypothetical protein